VLVHFFSYSFL